MANENWYSHPVIALAGAFSAGIASTLTIAIPIYNTAAQNSSDSKLRQVEEQYHANLRQTEEKYAAYKADIANIAALRKKNEYLITELSQARTEVWQLSDKKPFVPGSPIPVGLESIKPGISIYDLKKLLTNSKISQSGRVYFATLHGGFIKRLQIITAKEIVKMVVYYVDDTNNDKERLVGAVSAAFGKPSSRRTNDDGEIMLFWNVGEKTVTILGNQYSVDDKI